MDSAKYVIFDWPGKGEVPIIFPSHIGHDEISNSINDRLPGVNPVRAGFVEVCGEIGEDGPFVEAFCGGRSFTLGLKSSPEIDSILIEVMLKE